MPEISNLVQNTDVGINPASYRLNEIQLLNHHGREIDISELVTDFNITESIFTPYLTLEVNIKDRVNFMEEFELSGQERILINYTKNDPVNGRINISKEFIVTEYPVYGRTNSRVQVYSIRAISEHAYIGKLQKISKAYTGTVTEIIKRIFVENLLYPEDKIEVSSLPSPNVEIIIPRLYALDTIQWLLSRCFTERGEPFFVFETPLEGIKIMGYSDLVQGDVYQEYNDSQLFTNDPVFSPDENYRQKVQKILEMNSDIKLSKFTSSLEGAYGSRSEYLNPEEKSYSGDGFNYIDEFPSMNFEGKVPNLSDSFTINEELLSAYPFTKLNVFQTRSDRNDMNSMIRNNAFNKFQSYKANMDSMEHSLKLFGDAGLTVGQNISLLLNKSIDFDASQEGYTTSPTSLKDRFLSGKYLVTSLRHSFGKEHYTNLNCIKATFYDV